jgi:hypothetical protein
LEGLVRQMACRASILKARYQIVPGCMLTAMA